MVGTDELQYVVLHGYRRAYRMMGSGPVLLLLHGLGCDSTTWKTVMPELAKRYTVIAPDLLGHGASDKPNADYSLGGYANGMRDLLTVLGIDKVTVVGHSLGGGIAMQFAYQYPERSERVVLVSTGGLGPEVTPMIRMLTVPGAGGFIAAATSRPLRPIVSRSMRELSRLHTPHTRDLDEVARIYESLADSATRMAVRRVTSNVLNWHGQYITMTDRAYLARLMPLMVVWGKDDVVIPSSHAQVAMAYATSAEVHILDDSGHFPHKDHPEEFCRLLTNFIDNHAPSSYHRGKWRALLSRGDQAVLEAVAEPAAEAESATSAG